MSLVLFAVSIHALLAECDSSEIVISWEGEGFNPRTPCGVRHMRPARPSTLRMFQSTHSLRSATITSRKLSQAATVSIHALLAECDSCPPGKLPPSLSFNPRTPCGVRQSLVWRRTGEAKFQSTHSLRSATLITRQPRPISYGFNPRTPCGVRPLSMSIPIGIVGFNPRTPCGVRLSSGGNGRALTAVSIHALLAECDP